MPLSGPIVWTRAADRWPADRELFRGDPARVISLPALRRERIPPGNCPLPPASGEDREWHWAFTSAFAVEAVAAHPQRPSAASAWAVGAATAAALGRAGFEVAGQPGGEASAGGAALLPLLLQEDPSRLGWVLPGGAQRAFDLVTPLAEAGFACRRWDLYRTVSGVVDTAAIARCREILLNGPPGVLALASPSAAEGIFLSAKARPGAGWQVLAIGPTTAEKCLSFGVTATVLPRPDLALLAQEAERLLFLP